MQDKTRFSDAKSSSCTQGCDEPFVETFENCPDLDITEIHDFGQH